MTLPLNWESELTLFPWSFSFHDILSHQKKKPRRKEIEKSNPSRKGDNDAERLVILSTGPTYRSPRCWIQVGPTETMNSLARWADCGEKIPHQLSELWLTLILVWNLLFKNGALLDSNKQGTASYRSLKLNSITVLGWETDLTDNCEEREDKPRKCRLWNSRVGLRHIWWF